MRIIEKVWFKGHPIKWLLVPLLLPLTGLFYFLSLLRRFCYKYKIFRSYQVGKPVIVVGNIGIGGNGKTPVVVFLVEQYKKIGLTPGVISRGYGGQAPFYPYLLSDESTAAEAGDEPILIYQRCGVPVVVGADRVANARLLIEQGCDIIIADDGLQHYRLARTVELVVIDGKRLFGNGLLLPAGPLREGLWRLKSVDATIVNGEDKSMNIPNIINHSYHHNLYRMTLSASEVCHLITGEKIKLDEFIKQYPMVNAMAGIGSPERFFETLTHQGFALNVKQGFVDHHDFNQDDFTAFNDKLPLLMTEKDAVKCHSFAKSHWWYLPVNAQFDDEPLVQLMTSINKVILIKT